MTTESRKLKSISEIDETAPPGNDFLWTLPFEQNYTFGSVTLTFTSDKKVHLSDEQIADPWVQSCLLKGYLKTVS
jgi:hypothetical protein